MCGISYSIVWQSRIASKASSSLRCRLWLSIKICHQQLGGRRLKDGQQWLGSDQVPGFGSHVTNKIPDSWFAANSSRSAEESSNHRNDMNNKRYRITVSGGSWFSAADTASLKLSLWAAYCLCKKKEASRHASSRPYGGCSFQMILYYFPFTHSLLPTASIPWPFHNLNREEQ